MGREPDPFTVSYHQPPRLRAQHVGYGKADSGVDYFAQAPDPSAHRAEGFCSGD